jgi:hypothetical protein
MLEEFYHVNDDDIQHMSDMDLMDLYEEVIFDTGHAKGLEDADNER